jgi:deoxyribodipyrimidine photo-lyase
MSRGRPRVSVHWFRRDLRLSDNHGLFRALSEHGATVPLFIFDTDILDRLEERTDRRVDFIHRTVQQLSTDLSALGSGLVVEHGRPLDIWRKMVERYDITTVTANHDHEPYGRERDRNVEAFLREHGIPFHTFKDSSIFERAEVMKEDGGPYTVFTPYSRKWRAAFDLGMTRPFPSLEHAEAFHSERTKEPPTLRELGFRSSDLQVPSAVVDTKVLRSYHETRDLPGVAGTSRMGLHLRFGTVSIRDLVRNALKHSDTYLNELIWREFFMQILWHFPHAEYQAFRPEYEHIRWRNDEGLFQAWCEGRTGYPLVDAGMRELNATGHMHNRVRMVTASFLCKHLLTDWRWGEAWFGQKLLDLELSSNNGNWQWASGSGCDAAPWFRIFNPTLQLARFDPALTYVKQWVPEYGGTNYAAPIVVHKAAREEAIKVYTEGLKEARRER